MYLYHFVIFLENEVKNEYSLLDLMIRDKNGFSPLQYGVKNQTTSHNLQVNLFKELSS